MAAPVLVVHYRDVVRGLAQLEKAERAAVRKVLRQTGEAVKLDAAGRIAPKDGKTAAGFRVVVRQRGVAVAQALRKTTGAHPEWGAYQMRRALIPAVSDKQDETERAMEHALDVISETFNHSASRTGD
jgi:hypothetical protein